MQESSNNITIEFVQNLLYENLKNFDEFCNKNDINYSLAYGTLLGAVRHGGFIPWDDDVDVLMTRSEYEKFKKLYSSNKYKLLDHLIDEKYPYLFPKIVDTDTSLIESNISNLNYEVGLYIDIFLLDDLPNSKIVTFTKKIRFKIWYILYRIKVLNLKGLKKCLKIFSCFFSTNFIIKKINKIYAKTNNSYKRYFDIGSNMAYSKDDFNAVISKGKFNDINARVPENYDNVLRQLYGEYMKLPPKDKRISNHSYSDLKVNQKKGDYNG